MAKKTTSSSQKKVPGWVWAFNLALAAMFLYFLYYLKSVPETTEIESPGQTTTKQSTSPQKPAEESDAPQKEDPRFKFYDMLPETEVVAPKVEEYTPKKLPENYAYMLQTGSFRTFDDAERQRAMIGFQGLKAQVEKYQASEDNIWFRVKVGPFTSRSKMNSAVDKLVAINIQPLVKKLKTDKE
ncbi:SPOR domain-containing protein [Hahella ganghwensis]|uniref:SPOR domain-containing protein n=1 Tax=Hahella ganghwensis TaxID=286420 RepID=UPI000686164D|nr:SPOR domain-containing protein [Hahella ganghwensis]